MTLINQKKLFLRAEKPIAKKKEKFAKSKLLKEKMEAQKKQALLSGQGQQFKSKLEMLHKAEVRSVHEAKVKSQVRKSMHSQHSLAGSIAKSLGLWLYST